MNLFLMIVFLINASSNTTAIKQNQWLKSNSRRSTVNGHRSTITHNLSIVSRTSYYKALEENNKDLVNTQLTELKTAPDEIRDGLTGAMLMKKASFFAAAATKLHLFREGHKMLEDAIKKDPENAEFRFLRLIIQEHAPGVLGYKNDLQNDSELIRKSYKSLPEELQQIMIAYSKKSKFLKLEVS